MATKTVTTDRTTGGTTQQEFGTTGATTQTGATTGQEQFGKTSAGTVTPTEDPMMSMFRQALMPMLMKQFAQAQQPIFGQAQKAGFYDTTNRQSGNAFDMLKQRLASVGALDSGRLSQGATDIETKRMGDITGFERDLPFMESEAQFKRMLPLFNVATAFAGQAPRGQVTTGQEAGAGTTATTSQTAGTSNTTGKASTQTTGFEKGTTQEKTPLWQDILGGFGKIGGDILGGAMSGWNPFKFTR